MCHPIAFAVIAGAGTAIADQQEKTAQWQYQKAAVDRRNAEARLAYEHKLNLAAHKDKRKGQVFKAQLEALAQARTALHRQRDINQQEANRASVANQLERNAKFEDAMLKGQKALVSSIKAQGKILASGMNAGQSLLLEVMDTERQRGFQEAELSAGLQNANKSFAMTEYGIALDKYSADAQAVKSLPNAPITPTAEWAPVKPLVEQAPSKPGLLGSIMAGVSAGVSAGYQSGGTDWWKTS